MSEKSLRATVTALLLLGFISAFRAETSPSCHGAYDLYFVLDRSGSVSNDWIQICEFVKNIVEGFVSPNMKVSFIIFSSGAEVILPLTGERTNIQDGLQKLSQVIPAGDTYMHEGIRMANKQMKEQSKNSSSIIVALTDGKLAPYVHELTVQEANIARQYGARVYCVGVNDFDKDQLADVADSINQVFPVKDGFQALKGIVNLILKQSCTEILTVEPSCVCVNQSFELVLRGKGFMQGRDPNGVICNFLVDGQTYQENSTTVQDDYVLCPAPVLQYVGQKMEVLISLNGGTSFVKSPFTITASTCTMASSPKISRGENGNADVYADKLKLLSYRCLDPLENNNEVARDLRLLSEDIWRLIVLKDTQNAELEKSVSMLRKTLEQANNIIAKLTEEKEKAMAAADFCKDGKKNTSTKTAE